MTGQILAKKLSVEPPSMVKMDKKKKGSGMTRDPFISMVPEERIELSWGCPRGILSPKSAHAEISTFSTN
jgi:hypothetical protein